MNPRTMTARILRVVQLAPAGLSMSEIAGRSGFELSSVRNAVKRLMAARKVERIGTRMHSRYACVGGVSTGSQ